MLILSKYRTLLISGLLIIGLALFYHPQVKAASPAQPNILALENEIDNVLADPRLEGAQANVLVRSTKDGSVLYSRNQDGRLIPASNNKLYSSTSAIEVLGLNYQFTTSVISDGHVVGPTLVGNLYLKGTGDPTVQPSDYDSLASSVANSGIKVVTGKLIADDTFFDNRQLGNNWAWDNNPFSFQPEISALTVAADPQFDVGSITVETTPGSLGRPAIVKTVPATNFVQIENETTTGPAGSTNTLSIERKLGVNTIVVSGSIPQDNSTEDDLSTVSDTTGYVQSIFRDDLMKHGVQVLGGLSRGPSPSNGSVIVTRKSMPLSQLLTPFLKLSNNGIAEILVKSIGKRAQDQGTWDAGVSSELNTLGNTLGVNTSEIQLVDGSGLSNLDFTSPQQTTNLLITAQSKPWFSTWYQALPIAGEPDPLVGGTLRSRMVGTKAAGNVHGKTGTLGGVSALSGYVTDADGELLVFSIMENNFISSSPKPLEDAIAIALANFSRKGSGNTPHIESTRLPSVNIKQPQEKSPSVECSWTKKGC